jgi:RNA polymerase sigma factor (sigma-70 family)
MHDNSTTIQPCGSLVDQNTPITDWVSRFDDESVRELMVHYRPLLSAIVRRHWRSEFQSRMDPSDAVQLTWASIAQASERTQFVNRFQFISFLIKTLNNQIVDIRRSLFAQKRSVAQEAHLSWSTANETLFVAPEEQNALDRLIQQELAQEVLHGFLRLPRELRRMLRWRFRDGMTYAAIAGKIDRKEDDVRYLIKKCIQEIRRGLQIHSSSGDDESSNP